MHGVNKYCITYMYHIYFAEKKPERCASAKDIMVDFQELEVGQVVGRGNFGVVHRGRWNGRDVALKIIRIPTGYDTDSVSNYKEIAILRFIVLYSKHY